MPPALLTLMVLQAPRFVPRSAYLASSLSVYYPQLGKTRKSTTEANMNRSKEYSVGMLLVGSLASDSAEYFLAAGQIQPPWRILFEHGARKVIQC